MIRRWPQVLTQREDVDAGCAHIVHCLRDLLVGLTETINAEEGANGIRACCICPAEVATPIMDRRPVPPSKEDRARMLQEEDLGATIAFVASLPPRACINEIIISPTWNRSYVGGFESNRPGGRK